MEQSDLLRHLVTVLEALKLRYFVTGSVGTVFFGEPRFTNDIDVVVALQPAQIDAFCRAFPASDYYVSREAMLEAITHEGQFNIYHPASGLKIDVLVPSTSEYNESRFRRARRVHPAPGVDAWFAAPEDLILKKMQYYQEGGSDKHLRDITGILKVSGDQLDVGYVQSWSERLGVADIWRRIQEHPGL